MPYAAHGIFPLERAITQVVKKMFGTICFVFLYSTSTVGEQSFFVSLLFTAGIPRHP